MKLAASPIPLSTRRFCDIASTSQQRRVPSGTCSDLKTLERIVDTDRADIWIPSHNIGLTLILLITTIVVSNLFYLSTKSLLLGMKCDTAVYDFVIKTRNFI